MEGEKEMWMAPECLVVVIPMAAADLCLPHPKANICLKGIRGKGLIG